MAALLVWAAVGRSMAQPAVTPPLTDNLSGGSRPERFLFFSGIDLWSNGLAGYNGMLLAPKGDLNNDGFLVRLFMSDNLERYDTATQRFTTNIFRASALPGWRTKRGDLEIRVFAGPTLEIRGVKPDVQTGKLSGSRFGGQLASELWWEPTPAMMVAASGAITTIYSVYSARAAAGWRLFDRFWIGPEVSVSTDRFSTQYRIGTHLTGFKTGMLEWSVGAGLVEDSFDRSGIYGRVSALLRK
ncbi:hypothetical protein GGQ85_001373 [Nitrobacter vulgaris]|jgi:hypothetical protein|uniref:cellulose biosynthesis protein BcsS n=1 Tax=Nitrobacter vulgaris TaxID=29421 RepID=UPI00285FB348|nr:cellulose biosynthesis protein BcsS [Nitrobacter vulgaris]MDR6303679.1 hypothetical protein [Nitrobacter vulgaris]